MTREEAQQAWKKMRSEIDNSNWLFVGTINPQMVDIAIEALQADRPRGKWVEEQKRNFLDTRLNVGIEKKKITGKGYHTYLNVRCTNCNKVTMVDETIIYSYCPHCGARMDGERSEE